MFQPGDVVECIETCISIDDVCLCGCRPIGVVKGQHYRVLCTVPPPVPWSPYVGVIVRGDPHWVYAEILFRKLEKGVDIFSLVKDKKAPKELEPV